jgi:UDP-4-amino-4,6-dideoxy-N-acetyl-beta-L-altrosamine N-acetyltransferase
MKFINIREEHLEQILRWRTSEFVTKYMYTDVEYNMENQRKWFERIQEDEHSYYWLLAHQQHFIGFVSITNINVLHKYAYWNFYIGDPHYSMIAGLVGIYVYNHAFQRLGLHKLMGEVMEGNENVRKLHIKQGAREVGVLQEHVWKYGRFHNVYLYEMTKSRWEEKGKKFHNLLPIVEDEL